MKKNYLIPEVNVVSVEPHAHILNGASPVGRVSSNADITYGGGNAQSARVKDQGTYDVWDDNWSAE